MTEQEFINQLRPMITMGESKWHTHPVHYMGRTILTTNEMKAMLSAVVDGYNELTTQEQNKMRRRVFDALKDE